MSNRSAQLSIALATCSSACALTPGPKNWMPTGQQSQTSTFGAWIEIQHQAGDTLGGELVSADNDTLFIFHGKELVAVSRSSIKSGRLIGWDAGASEVTQATALGTVSTIGNGVILVLTAPAWILTGVVASRGQAEKPQLRLEGRDFLSLRPWARFPQGFPAGLDRARLMPKPPPVPKAKP